MFKNDYRFHPDWKTTLFVAVLLPLLLSLGVWQLQREQEKIDILHSHEQRMALPAANLKSAWADLRGPQAAYRRVAVAGSFLPQPTLLLDNKINAGVVGFHVIQLFELAGTNKPESERRLVWVNRGWIAGHRLRSELPTIETPVQGITLHAHIYQPLGEAFVLEESDLQQRVLSKTDNKPIIAQQFELTELQLSDGQTEYFPYLLRLETDSVAAYSIDWPAVNTQPEKHQAYAIQWFAMALALLVFYLIRSIEVASTESTEREHSDEQ